jgi:uncharacterized membrane protein
MPFKDPDSYKKISMNDNEMLYKISSHIFLSGIYIASLFCIFGATIFLLKEGLEPINYHNFQNGQGQFTSLVQPFTLMKNSHPIGFIEFGILILIFTPLFRVFTSIFIFVSMLDFMYAIISSIVFFIILIAIFIGLVWS